jgi:hypothetical protein
VLVRPKLPDAYVEAPDWITSRCSRHQVLCGHANWKVYRQLYGLTRHSSGFESSVILIIAVIVTEMLHSYQYGDVLVCLSYAFFYKVEPWFPEGDINKHGVTLHKVTHFSTSASGFW